jgi:glucose-6-phosphate-specific signal transduction histidine kinase
LGSLVVGILAFLVQSISNKDQKGIVIHGSVISLYLALLFKKYTTGRISNFLVLLMVATVACSLVLELDNCLRYDNLQMAWDYLVSSGFPGKEILFFHSFVIWIFPNILIFLKINRHFSGNFQAFINVLGSRVTN